MALGSRMEIVRHMVLLSEMSTDSGGEHRSAGLTLGLCDWEQKNKI